MESQNREISPSGTSNPHLQSMSGFWTSGVFPNDQLLVGPTVHPLLNDVLILFKRHPYVLTTDISKMYRNIASVPEDRDYHRFLCY